MKKLYEKGFTLIELLVVIAIIGILSSVVLVSLGGAKDRANDARIISDMDQIRTQAEIVDGNKGNVAMVQCTDSGNAAATPYDAADADIKTLCADVATLGDGSVTIYYDVAVTDLVGANYKEYCAYVQLNSGDYWCVDSSLYSDNVGSSAPTNCTTAAGKNSCK